jgi:hypothetical protein
MKRPILVFALSLATALPITGQSGSSNPSQNADPNSTPANNTITQDDQNRNRDDQDRAPDQETAGRFNYRVSVIQRSTEAVDYRDRGGTTRVDFKGTSLMPEVDGEARVTGHTGH